MFKPREKTVSEKQVAEDAMVGFKPRGKDGLRMVKSKSERKKAKRKRLKKINQI
jgi:hypothetical protein